MKPFLRIAALLLLLCFSVCGYAESIESDVTPEPVVTPANATPIPMATVEPLYTITPTEEPPVVENDKPYLIYVNYTAQIITVYTLDENGLYTNVVKKIITSSGKTNICPPGIYKIYEKRRWVKFLDGSYGQYMCRFNNHYLFHSIPYSKYNDNSKLISKDYGELGQNTSGGCMRMMCKDALWIYENCPEGTTVIISYGDEEPQETYDSIVQPELVSGNWDPTDPDPNNPDYYDESSATPCPTCYPYATAAPLDDQGFTVNKKKKK